MAPNPISNPTMRVRHPELEHEFVVIDADRFDPAVHVEWADEDDAEAAATRAAALAATPTEPPADPVVQYGGGAFRVVDAPGMTPGEFSEATSAGVDAQMAALRAELEGQGAGETARTDGAAGDATPIEPPAAETPSGTPSGAPVSETPAGDAEGGQSASRGGRGRRGGG